MSSPNATTFLAAANYGQEGIQAVCLYSLYALELALHVAELPISTLNLYIIFQSAVLHPNLKFILLCQSYAIFQRSFGRLLVDCVKFVRQEMVWDGSDLLQCIYRSAIYFSNFLGHILVLERAMATVLAMSYERRRRPSFSICWFIAVLAATIYNLYSRFSVERNPQEMVTSLVNLLTTLAILGLALADICLFCWLSFYNRRCYYIGNFDCTIEHSLSGRYQLCENIRTGRQLIPVFCFHFLNMISTSIIQSVFYFHPFQSQFAYDLTTALVVLWGTVNNLAIEISMIIFHPFLARRLKQMWQGIFARNKISEIQMRASAPPVDIDGTKLTNVGQEIDAYFSILTKAWAKI